MFERYTEKARRVIFFARYESSQFGSPYIEPGHILLGLIREDRGLTARFFPRTQVSVDSIRKEVERRITIHDRVTTSVDLPLSPHAKSALSLAGEESERLHQRYIGTEHLLLGLLREESSIAFAILQEQGLRLEAIREELRRSAEQHGRMTALSHLDSETSEHGSHAGSTGGQIQPDSLKYLTQLLEQKGIIAAEPLALEVKRVQESATLQAVLNILVKQKMLSPEEFTQLSTAMKIEAEKSQGPTSSSNDQ